MIRATVIEEKVAVERGTQGWTVETLILQVFFGLLIFEKKKKKTICGWISTTLETQKFQYGLKYFITKWPKGSPFCKRYIQIIFLEWTQSTPGLGHEYVCICIHIKRRESHDDVIKWKHFPRYWPFVRGIHQSPVNSLHKGQWRGALMFSFICVWINGWVNNREAGDLRHLNSNLAKSYLPIT